MIEDIEKKIKQLLKEKELNNKSFSLSKILQPDKLREKEINKLLEKYKILYPEYFI